MSLGVKNTRWRKHLSSLLRPICGGLEARASDETVMVIALVSLEYMSVLEVLIAIQRKTKMKCIDFYLLQIRVTDRETDKGFNYRFTDPILSIFAKC